ncbi:glycosyltransferase family 4 protein [Parablastomonas sp. CN1-191]|uniref:glycosyltransferase family 4 protein n=1 Tax=Parablastomonas sp. CN1-191 TaxID=3400908 RepID=UPI003BF7B1FE
MNLLLLNLRVDRDDTALGFTTDWINELAKHFDAITVITMYRGKLAVANNVTVLSCGLENGWSKPHRVAVFYRRLFEALRLRRHDVCFAHMNALFLAMAGPVLKARGIPAALWYAHNHRSRILSTALFFADRALASTKAGFPISTPKLKVIGQGIDTRRFRPAEGPRPAGPLRLITIGRFAPVKQIDWMIAALARLRREEPGLPVSLAIIGEALGAPDHAYVERCRALARELGVEDAIEWCGPVGFADVHLAYHRGDVFLSAGGSGLDKTILEAMASGLPVIAINPALAEPLGSFYCADIDAYGDALVRMARLGDEARAATGANLRDYVIREHDLVGLGRKIAGELKALVR